MRGSAGVCVFFLQMFANKVSSRFLSTLGAISPQSARRRTLKNRKAEPGTRKNKHKDWEFLGFDAALLFKVFPCKSGVVPRLRWWLDSSGAGHCQGWGSDESKVYLWGFAGGIELDASSRELAREVEKKERGKKLIKSKLH